MLHDVAYQGTFRLPEIYGIGFVVRPPHAQSTPPRSTSITCASRSSWTASSTSFAGIANDDHFATATPGYSIADVNEVRAGARYLFPDLRVAARLSACWGVAHVPIIASIAGTTS
ncbi:MAG: hypothetical protein U0166_21630 [Acidobacteriota bacterium]